MNKTDAPQNLEAEAAVLGSILRDGEALKEVADHLNPADFYLPTHGAIFKAMLSLDDAGEPITIVTIEERLKRCGADIPASKLAELVDHALPAIKEHVKIVVGRAADRNLLRLIEETEDALRNGGPSPEMLAALQAEFARRNGKSKAQPDSEHHFTLISAKDLLAEPDVETLWLLEDILVDAGVSLLAAKPKVGKTTFAFYLSVAVARGDSFLGYKTTQGPVVYLALEENKNQIKKQLRAANMDEELIRFHFGTAPLDAIKQVLPLIIETKAKFLVIDVLQKFIRVRDMNDYALVTTALEPIMDAARKQACHVMLTHHAGKMNREDGDDVLGSTALLGGVDTLVQIKKHDKRRAFFTIQRYGADIEQTVIDLTDEGLVAVGSRQNVEIEEAKPLIEEALKVGDSLTISDLYERVEKSKSLVSKSVALLLKDQRIYRSGSGKRNDAFKYSSLPPPSTTEGGKEETKTASNPTESKGESLPGTFLKNQRAQGGFQGGILGEKNDPKGGHDSQGFDWATGEQKGENE